MISTYITYQRFNVYEWKKLVNRIYAFLIFFTIEALIYNFNHNSPNMFCTALIGVVIGYVHIFVFIFSCTFIWQIGTDPKLLLLEPLTLIGNSIKSVKLFYSAIKTEPLNMTMKSFINNDISGILTLDANGKLSILNLGDFDSMVCRIEPYEIKLQVPEYMK